MTVLRRWGPWALLLLVAGVVLTVGVQRSGGPPSLDARVQHIASEVRCPVCHGETVAQSQAAPSVEIRNEIRADLQKGESESQILAGIVGAYGPGILEKPPAQGIGLLVWVVPVVVVVVAAAGLLLALGRWRRGSSVVTDIPPAGTAGAEAATADRPAPAPVAVEPVTGVAGGAAPKAAGRRRPSRLAVTVVGAALVAGGASWAVVASSGTRLPGQEITGASLGAQTVAADLQTAQDDEQRNDVVGALKLYQKILSGDPTQVQALAGEGWLLAQTGQPTLLRQGLTMLVSAERAAPTYGPAHVYRGLALLGEGDYADSVPELKWYLGHDPDPQLKAGVQKALAEAEAGQAAAAASPAATRPPG